MTVDILQVQETLSKEILEKMYAGPKADYPVVAAADLAKYVRARFHSYLGCILNWCLDRTVSCSVSLPDTAELLRKFQLSSMLPEVFG